MCKRHKRFVIFLDVDGVLNTTTTVQKTPDGYTGIDDARVEVLAKTIEKIGGADLVLSSDWKEMVIMCISFLNLLCAGCRSMGRHRIRCTKGEKGF